MTELAAKDGCAGASGARPAGEGGPECGSRAEGSTVRLSCFLRQHRPVLPSELLDSSEQARSIVEDARLRAERIEADARARAKAEADDARRELIESASVEAAEVVARSLFWRRAYEKELRGAMITAVLAVAERVWGELGDDRSSVAARVALEIQRELETSVRPVFRVHPDDAGALRETGLDPTPDPALEPGDCVVETEGAVHDGRARVRASLALDALKGFLARGAPEVEHEP